MAYYTPPNFFRETPPYDPRVVANTFLMIASSEGKTMRQMKLQKLVYIAHGWFLHFSDQPLITQPVEAWRYGPVIRTIRGEWKRYKDLPIDEYFWAFDESQGKWVIPTVPEGPSWNFIEGIWRIYGRYSGPELSDMTHNGQTPWAATYREGAEGMQIISDSLIKDHYRHIAEEAKRRGERAEFY